MGIACQIGASAKADAFIIIQNQIILINFHLRGNCVSPIPFPLCSKN